VRSPAYHSDEILDLSEAAPLPVRRLVSCYRREAGLVRQGHPRHHPGAPVRQAGDVLLRPAEDATAEHERLLGWEEQMLAKVELPYRVIDTAAGDLGSSAARKYDCEAWLPSQQRWLELTSTSNCTTFQARRLNILPRREGEAADSRRR